MAEGDGNNPIDGNFAEAVDDTPDDWLLKPLFVFDGDFDALVNIEEITADFVGFDRMLAKGENFGKEITDSHDELDEKVNALLAAGNEDNEAKPDKDADVHQDGSPKYPDGALGDTIHDGKDDDGNQGLEIINDGRDGIAKNIKEARLAGRDAKRPQAESQVGEPANAASWYGTVDKV